jgi:uncharacterized membrane protein
LVINALLIDDRKRYPYLRKLLRERILDSLTIVPIICLVGVLLLAWVSRWGDRYLIVYPDGAIWFVGSTAGVIVVTSVIATSMLSFLAVVFSVTVVALQLASQQFSPRVLGTLVGLLSALGTLIFVVLVNLGQSVIWPHHPEPAHSRTRAAFWRYG